MGMLPSAEVVFDELEAVPVLSVQHVPAFVFFLDPLLAVKQAAICVRVLRAPRLLVPAALAN